jgi:hypothetical protein
MLRRREIMAHRPEWSRTMTRGSQVVEVEMPDGTVVCAEVIVADSIADVGVWDRLRLEEAKGSIESFTRWAVEGVRSALRDPGRPGSEVAPDGMRLGSVGVEFGLKLAVQSGKLISVLAGAGAEATAVIRLEWERSPERAS